MPKIALIELYHHAEVLRSFYYALQDFKPSIFASRGFEINDLYAEISKNCPFYLRHETQSIPDFLSDNRQLLDGFDWLVFITIENNFTFFARQKWKPKTILLIHAVNYWLDYQRTLSLTSFSNIGKWIRDLICRQFRYRWKIAQQMDYLMFPDPLIREYFIKGGLLSAENSMPSLPLYLGSTNIIGVKKNECVIVVPGSIKVGMRDYQKVIQAFANTVRHFEKPVTLVLLGKPIGRSGMEVQGKLRSLERVNFSVVCFSGEIHQQEYNMWLKVADFLILPLRRDILTSECREIGGLTKISGAINDAVRFQKFALISDEYILDESYQKVTMKYSDAFDLGNKIVELIESLPISVNFYEIFSRWEKEGSKAKEIIIDSVFR